MSNANRPALDPYFMLTRHVERVLTWNATFDYFSPSLGLPLIPAVKLIVGTSMVETGTLMCQLFHRRIISAQNRRQPVRSCEMLPIKPPLTTNSTSVAHRDEERDFGFPHEESSTNED